MPAWLSCCQHLIRLPGESKGADREVAAAQRQGIPVHHGVEAFAVAMRTGRAGAASSTPPSCINLRERFGADYRTGRDPACESRGDPWMMNLRWGTRKTNEADKLRHGTRQLGSQHHQAKMNEEQVREARWLRCAGVTWSALASRFEVSTRAIRDAVEGRNWTWLN